MALEFMQEILIKETTNLPSIPEPERTTEDLKEFLGQNIEEPLDTQGLKQLIREKYTHLLKLGNLPQSLDQSIGSLSDYAHRTRAIEQLLCGDIRAVSTFVGGKVGGFIFNAQHEASVEEIIRIKSKAGGARQKLFALVSTEEEVYEKVETALLGNTDLKRFAGVCFVQVTVNPSFPTKLPKELLSHKNGKDIMQFFIPELGSPLEALVNESLMRDPDAILAGTSANYTGYPSLINRVHTSVFSIHHGISYLDNPGYSDNLYRGSYPIIRISNGGDWEIVR